MINNEFHLIGYAISDFVKCGTETFTFYTLKVEIDCFGKRSGQYKTAIVQVQSTNKTIDIYQQVRGKQVIVEGYIDFYVRENNNLVRCIATNISILGLDNRNDYVKKQRDGEQTQQPVSPVEDNMPF